MFDDFRDALRPEAPPEWWDYRLGRFVRTLWRIVFVIVTILVLGGLVDLVGLIE
jgi:hypothetical protein